MEGEAFERLYNADAGRLLSFLVYQTRDRILPEDLVADTCERVIRSRCPFDPPAGPRDHLALRNRPQTPAPPCSPEGRRGQGDRAGHRAPADVEGSGLEQLHAHDAIVRVLRNLSEDERRALALRYGTACR